MSCVNKKLIPWHGLRDQHRRLARNASIVLLVASLTGCASFSRDHIHVGSVPQDYRNTHPIQVSQSEISEDLIVTSQMQGISSRQTNIVKAFISRFRQSGASQIRIALPAGSHNEGAARLVALDILKQMKQEKLDASRIDVVRYDAESGGRPAIIRLSFDSVSANLPHECGLWDDDLLETSENRNYNNFGCATQKNLSNMISNPRDLINPRGQSEIDAERRDNVIGDWRTNGTPSLPSLL